MERREERMTKMGETRREFKERETDNIIRRRGEERRGEEEDSKCKWEDCRTRFTRLSQKNIYIYQDFIFQTPKKLIY